MRYIFNIFCWALISVGFASCGGNSTEWVQINSGDGGFSAMMPPNTVKSEKVEVTAFGKQKVHFITWKPATFSIDKFKLFQISYTTCPPNLVRDSIMVDFMLDSCIRMRKLDFTEKEEISVQNIELNGYPARAFFYDVKNGNQIVIVKECITNGRKYDLTVIANKEQGTNPEIARFFDSFQALR